MERHPRANVGVEGDISIKGKQSMAHCTSMMDGCVGGPCWD